MSVPRYNSAIISNCIQQLLQHSFCCHTAGRFEFLINTLKQLLQHICIFCRVCFSFHFATMLLNSLYFRFFGDFCWWFTNDILSSGVLPPILSSSYLPELEIFFLHCQSSIFYMPNFIADALSAEQTFRIHCLCQPMIIMTVHQTVVILSKIEYMMLFGVRLFSGQQREPQWAQNSAINLRNLIPQKQRSEKRLTLLFQYILSYNYSHICASQFYLYAIA